MFEQRPHSMIQALTIEKTLNEMYKIMDYRQTLKNLNDDISPIKKEEEQKTMQSGAESTPFTPDESQTPITTDG